MIEAAYVLPLFVLVLLFVLEAYVYALNGMVISDVVTDMHHVLIEEASLLAVDSSAGAVYTTCSANVLSFNTGDVSTALVNQINNVIDFQISDLAATMPAATSSNGFAYYTITVTGSMDPVVIPSDIGIDFSFNVKTSIAIKAAC